MIHRILPLAVVVALLIFPIRSTSARSALDLISGFDARRLESVYPLESPAAIAELAKLVYRLQTVQASSLADRVNRQSAYQSGSAVKFDGVVQQMRTIELPNDLADVLEFNTMTLMTTFNGNHRTEVFVAGPKPHLAIGDRVAGTGVVIGVNEPNSRIAAVAAARVKWFPTQVPNQGWELLRDAGVDVGLLADLKQRDRQSLSAADSDAFYGILRATVSINQANASPKPKRIDPLMLLQASKDQIGQWLELDLETVQVTRVFITETSRQQQLSRDHYYQLDAIVDLDNVVVKVNPRHANDQPALFEGRYPVSVVALELPPFLQDRIQATAGGDAVAAALHTKINVSGFFFRLWSYETEFMDAHGGGKQVGPLIIATTIRNREPPRPATDPSGIIGTLAALAVGTAVLAIFWWHRRTTADDRAARQARQAREASRVSEFHRP